MLSEKIPVFLMISALILECVPRRTQAEPAAAGVRELLKPQVYRRVVDDREIQTYAHIGDPEEPAQFRRY